MLSLQLQRTISLYNSKSVRFVLKGGNKKHDDKSENVHVCDQIYWFHSTLLHYNSGERLRSIVDLLLFDIVLTFHHQTMVFYVNGPVCLCSCVFFLSFYTHNTAEYGRRKKVFIFDANHSK